MEIPIPLAVVAGEYMDSATVVRWLKQPGDAVEAGEVIVLVETAKATMEVTAPAAGIVARVAFPVGTDVPVGEVLGWIETARVSPGIRAAPAPGRLVITPAARRLAAQLGVDPTSLQPQRPDGRITEADVRAAAGGGASATDAPQGDTKGQPAAIPRYTVVAPTPYRKVTAQRMVASAAIPQFQLTMPVVLDAMLLHRAEVRAERRPGLTAYLIRATAETLVGHPRLNSTYEDNELRQHRAVNIGVAVATDDGLAVPVIHNAPRLSVEEIHVMLQDLRHRAGIRGLHLEDVRGGTFTLSNLGGDGVLQFAALVNPPQTAILAVGTIHPDAAGRSRSLLTLSCDHRALDGADGAAFLRTLRTHLEQPDRI